MASWDDLRYFLALHRTGSHAAAAADLKVAASTVGRRVTALEAMLGARLFDKTPDGWALTPAGYEILPAAEGMERTMLDVERGTLGRDRKIEGPVRLTTSEALAPFVARGLARIHTRHPAIRVELLTANRSFDLTRREADIAVRVAQTDQEDLIVRRLAWCGWALYASADYAVARGRPPSADDLRGHDVIGFSGPISSMAIQSWLDDPGRGANMVMRAGSILAVRSLAAAGVGIGAMPCFLAAEDPGLVRIVRETIWTVPMHLVVHRDLIGAARIRAAVDAIAEWFEDHRLVLTGDPPAEPAARAEPGDP